MAGEHAAMPRVLIMPAESPFPDEHAFGGGGVHADGGCVTGGLPVLVPLWSAVMADALVRCVTARLKHDHEIGYVPGYHGWKRLAELMVGRRFEGISQEDMACALERDLDRGRARVRVWRDGNGPIFVFSVPKQMR